ncbi:ATP-binding cassette domain-containing protein [Nitratireductor sp. XY-223]|uniref:ABC transporter permease subunit n=1 Tax=Nitratireductor sp. XY-223 TaxID=2561926 RepID=UPI0010AB4DA2|nr:ATP-binding cassette domain-containing protein [Nitratireductor sp. XY-223]
MAYSRVASLLAFVLLLAVPALSGMFTAYQLGLYLIFGLVGQGIALCWGRAGFLPLGQALFFGIGAYIAGAALKGADGNVFMLVPLLAVAVAVPALLAALVGLLVFNRQIGSGPYFSLITLALTMLGFQLANSADTITGGFNGMTGIPGLPGIDSFGNLYFVIVGVLAVVSLGLYWLLKTPFGVLLSATAQNEERLQFFGFNTSALKAAAFGISAGLAGLAGALYAPHQGIVTPQSVGFLLSAEFVIWTAVGGRASIAGPVIGAVVIGFLASELRDAFRYWEAVIGLIFIVTVLKFPQGLVGLAGALPGWFSDAARRPSRRRDVAAPPHRSDDAPSLVFDSVGVRIGPVRILDGLSLRIDKPGIHAIIGPNGAGKTSAFNAMTGRLPLTAGNIAWHGHSLAGLKPYQVARRDISRKFQVPSVFADLTVDENLDIALWANRIGLAALFSMRPHAWRSDLFEALAERFVFLKDGGTTAGALSLGQRQMLDFSMTYLTEARLVLLDEPCAGLSTGETAQMIEAIAAINASIGSTAIIIEHDMRVVERLSDHVFVMHQGRLLAEGNIAAVRADPEVQAVYSGGTK